MAFGRSRVTDNILRQFAHNREFQRFLIDISTATADNTSTESLYRNIFLSVSDIYSPTELNAKAGNFNGSVLIAFSGGAYTLYSYDSDNLTQQLPIYVSGSPGTWVAIASNAFAVKSGKKRITSADSPYTVKTYEDIIYCDTDGGNIVLNVPSSGLSFTASTIHRKIINSGSSGNTVAVTPLSGAKLFGSAAAFTLYDSEIIDLHYDATEGWY